MIFPQISCSWHRRCNHQELGRPFVISSSSRHINDVSLTTVDGNHAWQVQNMNREDPALIRKCCCCNVSTISKWMLVFELSGRFHKNFRVLFCCCRKWMKNFHYFHQFTFESLERKYLFRVRCKAHNLPRNIWDDRTTYWFRTNSTCYSWHNSHQSNQLRKRTTRETFRCCLVPCLWQRVYLLPQRTKPCFGTKLDRGRQYSSETSSTSHMETINLNCSNHRFVNDWQSHSVRMRDLYPLCNFSSQINRTEIDIGHSAGNYEKMVLSNFLQRGCVLDRVVYKRTWTATCFISIEDERKTSQDVKRREE